LVEVDHVEKTSLEPKIHYFFLNIDTLDAFPTFCYFLINSIYVFRILVLARNMDFTLTTRSTNHITVLSNVVLIREQTSNDRTRFKTKFLHSARFVVM